MRVDTVQIKIKNKKKVMRFEFMRSVIILNVLYKNVL